MPDHILGMRQPELPVSVDDFDDDIQASFNPSTLHFLHY
jgi:hypothetical protein